MQPFLLVILPKFVFDILNRRTLSMQTHAIYLLANAAEKRAHLLNSSAFWQPSRRVVTFHSIVTSTIVRALKFSSCVFQAIEVLASIALVSLVVQAKGVKFYDLCSSTVCRERSVCACARIAVNMH